MAKDKLIMSSSTELRSLNLSCETAWKYLQGNGGRLNGGNQLGAIQWKGEGQLDHWGLYRAMLLHWGQFYPQRPLWQHLETFLVVTTGGKLLITCNG